MNKKETGHSCSSSQQDATAYKNLLFHVYIKLKMFQPTHRPSSGAQNCTSSAGMAAFFFKFIIRRKG
jgi:hypothetical protein